MRAAGGIPLRVNCSSGGGRRYPHFPTSNPPHAGAGRWRQNGGSGGDRDAAVDPPDPAVRREHARRKLAGSTKEMDVRRELGCLPPRQAPWKLRALGLPTSGPTRQCIERLAEHFLVVPRQISRVEAPRIPTKTYRRLMSLLDHVPFEKVNPPVTEKIGRLRAASVSNASFSMGTDWDRRRLCRWLQHEDQ